VLKNVHPISTSSILRRCVPMQQRLWALLEAALHRHCRSKFPTTSSTPFRRAVSRRTTIAPLCGSTLEIILQIPVQVQLSVKGRSTKSPPELTARPRRAMSQFWTRTSAGALLYARTSFAQVAENSSKSECRLFPQPMITDQQIRQGTFSTNVQKAASSTLLLAVSTSTSQEPTRSLRERLQVPQPVWQVLDITVLRQLLLIPPPRLQRPE